jgi:hypothetical protein
MSKKVSKQRKGVHFVCGGRQAKEQGEVALGVEVDERDRVVSAGGESQAS